MTENIKLTDEQQSLIKRAIELVTPFDKEKVAYGGNYFEVQDDDGNLSDDNIDFADYDCCDSDKCVNKILKELKKEHKGVNIQPVYWANDGDHENIASCYNCGKPLNEQLTWIKSEFDHHKEYTVTKEALISSRNAFDVRCMLEAMPSCDERIMDYAMHQKNAFGNEKPYNESKKRQEAFVESFMEYVQKVITALT